MSDIYEKLTALFNCGEAETLCQGDSIHLRADDTDICWEGTKGVSVRRWPDGGLNLRQVTLDREISEIDG